MLPQHHHARRIRQFGAAKVHRPSDFGDRSTALSLSRPRCRSSIPPTLVYADIRAQLEVQGRPIGPTDLFIAAHALSLDLTLVTANVREFSRVPDLLVENWLD